MSIPPTTVAQGLIDFLLHPPYSALQPNLDYLGPYTLNNTLTTWSITPGPVFLTRDVRESYGVMMIVNGSIPPNWGFSLGWYSDDGLYDEASFDPPLAQLVVQHQFPTGAWITTQRAEMRTTTTALLWDVALPGRLGLRVAPNLAVDLFYITGYNP